MTEINVFPAGSINFASIYSNELIYVLNEKSSIFQLVILRNKDDNSPKEIVIADATYSSFKENSDVKVIDDHSDRVIGIYKVVGLVDPDPLELNRVSQIYPNSLPLYSFV